METVAKYNLYDIESIREFTPLLKDYIETQKLSKKFGNSKYVLLAGWQFAGLAFGIFSRPMGVEKISDGKKQVLLYYRADWYTAANKKYSRDVPYVQVEFDPETDTKPEISTKFHKRSVQKTLYAYRASCILHDANQNQVGGADAICSNLEPMKDRFEEFSVASMAQTRCLSKAYRMLLGPVIEGAGYESTPAEEMDQTMIEPGPPKKDKDSKKKLPAAKFKAVLGQLERNELTVEDIEKLYDLTEEQQDKVGDVQINKFKQEDNSK